MFAFLAATVVIYATLSVIASLTINYIAKPFGSVLKARYDIRHTSKV